MKESEKDTDNLPQNILFFLIVFTSVVTSLKRVEEWYHQLMKDDGFCVNHKTADLLAFSQNIPASIHLQCMFLFLLFFYGILCKNAYVLVFSILNTLAIIEAIVVTHAEFHENMRNF